MTKSEEVYQNRYYTLGEILKGMIIVTFALVVCDSYNDVFIEGKIFDNYCCCNLEIRDKQFEYEKSYGENTFSQNPFCIYFNSTRKTSKVVWNSGNKLASFVGSFKEQKMTNQEFNLYLYLRNIPLYVLPNVNCDIMLNRLNLNNKKMKYSCVDINIEN